MRPRRKGKQTASDGATPGAPTPTEQARERSPEPTAGEPAASEHTPGATVPDGAKSSDGSAAQPAKPVNSKPTARVRNRLIVAVAVVAAAIAGAGAPAVVAASGQLSDAQDLVTLAERTQQAVSLSHSLADERDEVTSYIAAGRPKGGKGLSESRSARVDRQIDELRSADAPAGLRRDLADIAAVRRAALTGKSSALEAHTAYSDVITGLHALTRELAEQTRPARAPAAMRSPTSTTPSSRPPPPAACSSPPSPSPAPRRPAPPSTRSPACPPRWSTSPPPAPGPATPSAPPPSAPTSASRPPSPTSGHGHGRARATYDSTVTGTEVTTAEKYLSRPHRPAHALRRPSSRYDQQEDRRRALRPHRDDARRRVLAHVKRTKDLASCATTTSRPWRSASRSSASRCSSRSASHGHGPHAHPPARRPAPRLRPPRHRARAARNRSASRAATTSSPRSYGPSTRCTATRPPSPSG